MELSKNFEPTQTDEKWYSYWMEKEYFKSVPDEREPYCIVMPPPNVTGILHMGHALNNTIQDILIRRARMQGKNACWVPGTDHASIATEAKVVGMLRERGIAKSSLSRDEFLGYAWEWKEKYGGIILQQLKKLGCSLDWDRTHFTMDKEYAESVLKVFVDLHKKGMIYRGKRMINWDVKALTALSDEEVIRRETKQKLYYLSYAIEGSDEKITIATVRPETIMGDSAIAVHPDDPRFTHLHGKMAIVPLINRKIRIIKDDYVSMDFGTGALKITPAHDMNDNALGQKHNLEIIDILNEDGTLNKDAQIYVGEDRFAARKKIVVELEEKGFLIKTEEYTSEVGYSERTDTVVEPRLSLQWWVSMQKLAEPALHAVLPENENDNADINFYPTKFKNLYRHWMVNIKDWCISRQLWWGHRIPAWYDEAGNYYVAETLEKLHEEQPQTKNLVLKQDDDCLDTWFSSWIWPMEVFKGISNPGNKDFNYYYPTQTLVTAPEIIFFWVARMIMAGYEYEQKHPFESVYFTGIVRDKLGRKMSKSLGNSPDLLKLIEHYGADATRFGILITSPAGNDILFDESTLEQGRNFNNKIWNALKLMQLWENRSEEGLEEKNSFAVEWFGERLNQVKAEVEVLMQQFKLSEALKVTYSLIWDDFCSWYLEWVKPGFEETMPKSTYLKTKEYFSELLKLLHPFMPFITEEIHQHLATSKTDIMISQIEPAKTNNESTLTLGNLLKDCITAVRDVRNKQQLKPKEAISLQVQTEKETDFNQIINIWSRQINASTITFTKADVPETLNLVLGKDKFFIDTGKPMDTGAQKENLEKELKHLQGFLLSVDKKLSNEKFVQNAQPQVLVLEQQKKADAEAKIKMILESLSLKS